MLEEVATAREIKLRVLDLGKERKLRRLIDAIPEAILDRARKDAAHEIANWGNAALHESGALPHAWDTLAKTIARPMESVRRIWFRQRTPWGGTPIIDPRPLPSELSKPSDVVVLKLHGSLGWYDRRDAQPYFDSDFLSLFNLVPGDATDIIHDPRQPDHGPADRALISYPSFLKKFDAPVMQTIWERASRALREATELEVWGYSLPSSDSATRVLLNSLPYRLSAGSVDCLVHIPDPQRDPCETDFEYEPKRRAAALTRERWKHFLGSYAKIDKRALGLEEVRTV